MPNSFTVLIDSREQRPLLFPAYARIHNGTATKMVALKTEVVALATGDYCIKGHENIAVVERKASAAELYKNFCTSDARRAAKAFGKLSRAKYPYLLLEISPSELITETRLCPDPSAVVMRLGLLLKKHRLHVLMTGHGGSVSHRRIVGGFLVSLMLGHILAECY